MSRPLNVSGGSRLVVKEVIAMKDKDKDKEKDARVDR
jgi:hypothetical protein